MNDAEEFGRKMLKDKLLRCPYSFQEFGSTINASREALELAFAQAYNEGQKDGLAAARECLQV